MQRSIVTTVTANCSVALSIFFCELLLLLLLLRITQKPRLFTDFVCLCCEQTALRPD